MTSESLPFVLVVAMVVVTIIANLIFASLPGHIARQRNHPNARAVGVCGWFGAVIPIFWMVGLIWAYASPEAEDESTGGFPLD